MVSAYHKGLRHIETDSHWHLTLTILFDHKDNIANVLSRKEFLSTTYLCVLFFDFLFYFQHLSLMAAEMGRVISLGKRYKCPTLQKKKCLSRNPYIRVLIHVCKWLSKRRSDI